MLQGKPHQIKETLTGKCKAETTMKLCVRQVETCVVEPCGRTSKVGTNNRRERGGRK